VHRGQFKEEAVVVKRRGKVTQKQIAETVGVASSMTVVVPSWEIKKIMETDNLNRQRKERDARPERGNASLLYQKVARAQEMIIPPPPPRQVDS
jgi:hypothetical protein